MKSIFVWANRPRSGERVRTLQKTRQKRPLRALKTYGAVVGHFPAELREQFSSLLPSFHRGFFGMLGGGMCSSSIRRARATFSSLSFI
jgi:hypothetical protein